MSEKIVLPSSMTALEMLVARRAVLFAKEIGIHNSIFEGNSEVVIDSLNKGYKLNSTFGNLARDTIVLSNSLQSFSFPRTFR